VAGRKQYVDCANLYPHPYHTHTYIYIYTHIHMPGVEGFEGFGFMAQRLWVAGISVGMP